MVKLSITAERVLELCAEAHAAMELRCLPQQRVGIAYGFERPAHDERQVEEVTSALKQTAENAIRLAGPGHAQVLLTSHDISVLAWVLGKKLT